MSAGLKTWSVMTVKKKDHIAKAQQSRSNKFSNGAMHSKNKGHCNALKRKTCQGAKALKQQANHDCNAPQYEEDPDFNAPLHSNHHQLKTDCGCSKLQLHDDPEDGHVPPRCMADALNIEACQAFDSEGVYLFAVDSSKGDIDKTYNVYVSVNGARVIMECVPVTWQYSNLG